MVVKQRVRAGRPVRSSAAAALVVVALGATLAACSAGKPSVLATQLAAVTTSTSTSLAASTIGTGATVRTTTTATRVGATTGAPSPVTARPATPTSTGTTGAAGATSSVAPANRCTIAAASPDHAPAPTLAGGRVVSSPAVGVRLAYPAAWPLTDLTVTASQILEPRLIPLFGLRPDSPLRPLTVRAPAQYPGIAVFKLSASGQDPAYVLSVMREFLWSRRFLVQNDIVTACLDGEVALGLTGTSGVLLQTTWLTTHRDATYLILCLGLDDGTAATQNALAADFNRTLDTLRWLG